MTLNRRDFVRWGAQLGAGQTTALLLQACSGGEPSGATVVPPLAMRNAYRPTNLAATKPGALVAAANPSQRNAAKPGEPVPFTIQVSGSRVFVMDCIGQVLSNANSFLVDASKPSQRTVLFRRPRGRNGRPVRLAALCRGGRDMS